MNVLRRLVTFDKLNFLNPVGVDQADYKLTTLSISA